MMIHQCLKKKLEEACENEKKLYCLLQQEKQRAACLEYQLCKRLEPTQDQGNKIKQNTKHSVVRFLNYKSILELSLLKNQMIKNLSLILEISLFKFTLILIWLLLQDAV